MKLAMLALLAALPQEGASQSELRPAPPSRWIELQQKVDTQFGSWLAADIGLSAAMASGTRAEFESAAIAAQTEIDNYEVSREQLLAEFLKDNPQAAAWITPHLEPPVKAIEQQLGSHEQRAVYLRQRIPPQAPRKGSPDRISEEEQAKAAEARKQLLAFYDSNNERLKKWREAAAQRPPLEQFHMESTADWVERMRKASRQWAESQRNVYMVLRYGMKPASKGKQQGGRP